MSWSFQAIGTPEKIIAALEDESAKQSGQSKVEFDAAKSHLAALVAENFASEGSYYHPAVVKLSANGSGSVTNGAQTDRNVSVSLERVYGKLLV